MEGLASAVVQAVPEQEHLLVLASLEEMIVYHTTIERHFCFLSALVLFL